MGTTLSKLSAEEIKTLSAEERKAYFKRRAEDMKAQHLHNKQVRELKDIMEKARQKHYQVSIGLDKEHSCDYYEEIYKNALKKLYTLEGRESEFVEKYEF